MSDRVFQTTGAAGLDHDLFPMTLWRKAKRRGIWDPAAIDLSRDVEDWRGLSDPERDLLLRLTSLFAAGEESVTLDLLPLIGAIAAEGRLEEEIYLTSFLWEEAKHVELFRRFLDQVAGARGRDLAGYQTPSYRRIFAQELPAALARLADDRSPEAQAEASVTYNLVVEGVLAETGYQAYFEILERRDLCPGMRQAVSLVQADEARHLAFGVYLLSRLVAEHGEPVWEVIERRMGELLGPTLAIIPEGLAHYDPVPFDLSLEELSEFAADRFRRRIARIQKARGRPLDEILGGAGLDTEADESS